MVLLLMIVKRCCFVTDMGKKLKFYMVKYVNKELNDKMWENWKPGSKM